jgi:hypothetical protein
MSRAEPHNLSSWSTRDHLSPETRISNPETRSPEPETRMQVSYKNPRRPVLKYEGSIGDDRAVRAESRNPGPEIESRNTESETRNLKLRSTKLLDCPRVRAPSVQFSS